MCRRIFPLVDTSPYHPVFPIILTFYNPPNHPHLFIVPQNPTISQPLSPKTPPPKLCSPTTNLHQYLLTIPSHPQAPTYTTSAHAFPTKPFYHHTNRHRSTTKVPQGAPPRPPREAYTSTSHVLHTRGGCSEGSVKEPQKDVVTSEGEHPAQPRNTIG